MLLENNKMLPCKMKKAEKTAPFFLIGRAYEAKRRPPACQAAVLNTAPLLFNFNYVQRALVLEDYAPALRVWGFVSRKKGARSMGEEKKEGEKKKVDR